MWKKAVDEVWTSSPSIRMSIPRQSRQNASFVTKEPLEWTYGILVPTSAMTCPAIPAMTFMSGPRNPRQPEVCFGCHQDVKIDVNKRSHHPILEGKIQCSSCHSPHGSLNKNMVKADDHQQLCFRCHADKRGPVVWEHPPVEENCMTCHDVHGSIHEQLLTERIPQLCQNCHDWSRHPGTPYDDSASFTSRWNCLRCHPAIHGSNSPSGGGFRFVR